MNNNARIIPLDNYRQGPTPLQLQADREVFAQTQRKTDITGAIAIGFITSLALCGLFLFVHSLGWLP